MARSMTFCSSRMLHSIRTAEVDSRRRRELAFVDKILQELRERDSRPVRRWWKPKYERRRRALIPKYRRYHRPIVRLHAR
jgi:hypothetical protein